MSSHIKYQHTKKRIFIQHIFVYFKTYIIRRLCCTSCYEWAVGGFASENKSTLSDYSEWRIQQGCCIKHYKEKQTFTLNTSLILSACCKPITLWVFHNVQTSLKFTVSSVYTFLPSYLRATDVPDRAERVEKGKDGNGWNMWHWTPSGPWSHRQLKEDIGREVYLHRLSRRGANLTINPLGWELFIEP